MSEKDYVAKGVVVRWNGIFDLEEVYKKSKEWFDTRVMDFKEEKYVERIKPGGKQLEIKWKAIKKESDYFKKIVEVGILIIGVRDVETEEEGRKFVLQKGEVEFQFDSYLMKNASNKFEEGGFSEKIYNIMYRRRVDDYKIDLYNSVYGLIEDVKKLMEMHA